MSPEVLKLLTQAPSVFVICFFASRVLRDVGLVELIASLFVLLGSEKRAKRAMDLLRLRRGEGADPPGAQAISPPDEVTPSSRGRRRGGRR